MWPNSGNRYYAENALELVDEEGEWYVSRRSGVLTYRPPHGTDPNTRSFVLDRGDSLTQGIVLQARLLPA